MNFEKALDLLKEGIKVQRKGWNGKDMWLYYVDSQYWEIGKEIPFDVGKIGNKLSSFVGMKTADNKFIPWVASQTDILADDWVCLECVYVC